MKLAMGRIEQREKERALMLSGGGGYNGEAGTYREREGAGGNQSGRDGNPRDRDGGAYKRLQD